MKRALLTPLLLMAVIFSLSSCYVYGPPAYGPRPYYSHPHYHHYHGGGGYGHHYGHPRRAY